MSRVHHAPSPQPIHITEAADLTTYEATIAAGLSTFVEIGLALRAIREGRLYRQDYATFEAYCAERWELERRHVYRLMDAAAVVENVSNWTHVLPATESQARPLTRLKPDMQRTAWQEAVQSAPNGQVTAAHVQAVVEQHQPPPSRRQRRWCVEDDVEKIFALVDRCWDHWQTPVTRQRIASTLRGIAVLLDDTEGETPRLHAAALPVRGARAAHVTRSHPAPAGAAVCPNPLSPNTACARPVATGLCRR